jgi:hypothetical protein
VPTRNKLSVSLQSMACTATLHAGSAMATAYCTPLLEAGYRHPDFEALIQSALWQKQIPSASHHADI